MRKDSVQRYYRDKGWEIKDGKLLDEVVNLNNSNIASPYHRATRRRIHSELSKMQLPQEKLLDVASGALHLPELLEYSTNFDERHCVDFSPKALELAKVNLTKDGQVNNHFYNFDFLDSNFQDGEFDAAISLHTLYHVDLSEQEQFVLKLIKSVRPGGVIIIAYSNPFSLRATITFPVSLYKSAKKLVKRVLGKVFSYKENPDNLYFARNNIFWWQRFKPYGAIEISALRTFTSDFETFAIPENLFGRRIFEGLYKIENKKLWAYLADYYIVTITRNGSKTGTDSKEL
jgi:2-polyprenyl-3-methyl-5-hydroxy-6-metoxy-1,4-benzoquinol methylase